MVAHGPAGYGPYIAYLSPSLCSWLTPGLKRARGVMEANVQLVHWGLQETSVSGMHWVDRSVCLWVFFVRSPFCSVCRPSQRPNFRYQMRQDTRKLGPRTNELGGTLGESGPVMIMKDGANGCGVKGPTCGWNAEQGGRWNVNTCNKGPSLPYVGRIGPRGRIKRCVPIRHIHVSLN